MYDMTFIYWGWLKLIVIKQTFGSWVTPGGQDVVLQPAVSAELLTQGALACAFRCHVAAVAVYNPANSTVGSPCCKRQLGDI